MVVAIIGLCAGNICKLVALRAGNLKELLVFDAIAHNFCQILRCRPMYASFILSIQSVWSNKICILTANLSCLLIHLFCKLLYTPRNMLRDCHSRVIMRFQHQRVQQISQVKFIIRAHAKPDFRHGGRITADAYLIFQIAKLQREDAGHDFCRTGIRHMLITVLFI